ncbi:MAG: 3-phosphoshikimate 1-carboxyvinyltransferase [Crocinitomicaceae bacterium]
MKRIDSFIFNHKIEVNASKSHLQRALALSLLAKNKMTLIGCDQSRDVEACKKILLDLGCTIEGNKTLQITPPVANNFERQEISVGESGLALRMFSSIAKRFAKTVIIHAEGSLLSRPIDSLVDSLQKTGILVEQSTSNFPLILSGEMSSKEIHVDGSFSSQILSGLLISAPLLPHHTTIFVDNLTSKPYIDLTLEVMRDFGVEILNENYKRFEIKGNQEYTGRDYQIEGDWSGAANHIVGAAISGRVQLTGLQENSKQADRIILSIIQEYGAHVEWVNGKLIITKSEIRKPITVDLTDNPDLFPILAILACSASGTSSFTGTKRLIHKESNRLETVMEMLTVFGVEFSLSENTIEIHGTGNSRGGKINCHNDHRIAMAATVAACFSTDSIELNNPECITKSYPDFFNVLGL